jgi:hypothetical protein
MSSASWSEPRIGERVLVAALRTGEAIGAEPLIGGEPLRGPKPLVA